MSKRPIRSRKAKRRRLYPFLFFGTAVHGQDREHRPWQARDLLCLLDLVPALQRRGYEPAEVILNMPPQKGQPAGEIAPGGVRLGASDTLLVVTRLPLNDDLSDQKRVLRGYTQYEAAVLDAGRRVFAFLSRRKMLLQEDLWPRVRPGFESRRHIIYRQRVSPRFLELRTGAKGRKQELPAEERTSAFLLHTRLWEKGPTLIAVFAMDGISAIVWSQILARRHPDWLLEPGFTMVDLLRKSVPARMTLLNFSPPWGIEVVFRVRF